MVTEIYCKVCNARVGLAPSEENEGTMDLVNPDGSLHTDIVKEGDPLPEGGVYYRRYDAA